MACGNPYDFLLEHGIGIYFVKPYDEKKVPVLLVYGISGSAQDWRGVIAALDQSRYQPWLFYYPSGLRLTTGQRAMARRHACYPQKRYGFDQLIAVAYSMGGLVARGGIQRAVDAAGTNFIPEFVSVSTPWAGHEAAKMGVKYMNYPVPAWLDMVPDSDYLGRIFKSPLPAGTRHDLIFSYKSAGGIGLPDDNDGVVGVASELSEDAQSHAASVYGFNFNHDEILQSPLFIHHLEKNLSRVKLPGWEETKEKTHSP